jgi:hypothetical protein
VRVSGSPGTQGGVLIVDFRQGGGVHHSAAPPALTGLWSRLVSSMPYLKGDSPALLEANVPAITQAYITSR